MLCHFIAGRSKSIVTVVGKGFVQLATSDEAFEVFHDASAQRSCDAVKFAVSFTMPRLLDFPFASKTLGAEPPAQNAHSLVLHRQSLTRIFARFLLPTTVCTVTVIAFGDTAGVKPIADCPGVAPFPEHATSAQAAATNSKRQILPKDVRIDAPFTANDREFLG
jgi:hypothetical protein